MKFFKALALFVSNYIIRPRETVQALESLSWPKVNVTHKPSMELKASEKIVEKVVEKEVLKKAPDNQLDKLEKEFKTYKGHANAAQLGMTVTFLKKGCSTTFSETLRGVKAIEAFIKKAKDEKYTVL